MPLGSRVCPSCGKLNARTDVRCLRCGARVPRRWESGVGGLLEAVFGRQAPMTRLFVILSVGVYAFLVLGSGELSLLGGVLGSEALRWGALYGPLGALEPWRYLSAMFVHFGVLHVGLNCMALVALGRGVEQGEGSSGLAILFLLPGIAGFVGSDLWPGPSPMTGGISGGVFGLLGAFVGRRYAEGNPEWKRLAVTGLGYAAAMALLMRGGVNNTAHVAGLVSGALLSWALYRFGRGRRAAGWLRLIAAVLVVATFASLALSHASGVWRELQALERRGLIR